MRMGWGVSIRVGWCRRLMVVAGLVSAVALVAACGAKTTASPTPNVLAQPIGSPFAVAQVVGTPLSGEAGKGQQLFAQFNCTGCHGAQGQGGIGPPLKGLYGSQVQLDNGQTVTADDGYIRESIVSPDAKIVKGYQKGVMLSGIQSEESQIQADDNIAALIAYIKALK